MDICGFVDLRIYLWIYLWIWICGYGFVDCTFDYRILYAMDLLLYMDLFVDFYGLLFLVSMMDNYTEVCSFSLLS